MNALLNHAESLEVSMAKAIAKTWLEPEFARKLIQNPVAALAEVGVSIDSDVDIEVNQGSEAKWSLHKSGERTVYNLTLVPCPTELNAAIAHEDLENLETVSLTCTGCAGSSCC